MGWRSSSSRPRVAQRPSQLSRNRMSARSWRTTLLPCGHTGRRLEAAAGDVLPGPAPTPRTTGSGSRTDRAPVFRSPVVAKLQRYAPVIGLQFLAPLLLTPLIEVPVTAIAARGSAAAWRPAVL